MLALTDLLPQAVLDPHLLDLIELGLQPAERLEAKAVEDGVGDGPEFPLLI